MDADFFFSFFILSMCRNIHNIIYSSPIYASNLQRGIANVISPHKSCNKIQRLFLLKTYIYLSIIFIYIFNGVAVFFLLLIVFFSVHINSFVHKVFKIHLHKKKNTEEDNTRFFTTRGNWFIDRVSFLLCIIFFLESAYK